MTHDERSGMALTLFVVNAFQICSQSTGALTPAMTSGGRSAHDKLAILRSRHEVPGVCGPVHGVDLAEVTCKRSFLSYELPMLPANL